MLAEALAAARLLAPLPGIDAVVLPDPPVSALVDASAGAELLVVGMAGGAAGTGRPDALPLDVTTAAHCPVTVVRGEDPRDRLRTAPVLLGIESVDVDADAVTVAFDDADRHGTGVVVVHVADGPAALTDDVATLRERLAPWRSAHPGVAVTIRIGQGDPGVALLHESTVARHIVVGTRGRHTGTPGGHGAVSRFVLHHSLVPVTVVPRTGTTGGAPAPAAAAADGSPGAAAAPSR